ncbi:unannotated protein [freshwater metagenome]|uniref:Unannotated protein n=1 Tax=freshwater metagenome TaxID=449393 RepID=A0A6J7HGE6_9ZZZZ|nr:hypothetical protein [Actinomycetota bacterium]
MNRAAPMRNRLLACLAALALGAALAPSVATASAAPTPRVAPTCAQGGRCSIGDVGPGGGKIIAVNQSLRITDIDSRTPGALFVTTATPHGLQSNDKISISGVTPAALNVTGVFVDTVSSPTSFVIVNVADLSAFDYVSGGVIPKAPGRWKYLQAAPAQWAETAQDPVVIAPHYPEIADGDLDWRIGSGNTNTEILQAQNVPTDAFSNVVADSGVPSSLGWYIPSYMELWAMYKVLAKTAASVAANGLSSGGYFSSTVTSYDVTNGNLWITGLFSRNLQDDPSVGFGSSYNFDGASIRPVRKLWFAPTNLAIAKRLDTDARIQIASVTKEGSPVSIRVLKGSVCTISAPAKQNRKTFFTLTGDKKAGTCSLRITAPETYQYWALNQTKTITVK